MLPELHETAARIVGRHAAGVNILRELPIQFLPGEDAAYDLPTRTIWVSLSGMTDPRSGLRHEVIHALRSAGVFTRKEWSALVRGSKAEWMDFFDIRRRYKAVYQKRFALGRSDLDDIMEEEGVADRYGASWAVPMHWSEGVGRIIADIESGKIAKREAGTGSSRMITFGSDPQDNRSLTW
jgi:hypothetical protein